MCWLKRPFWAMALLVLLLAGAGCAAALEPILEPIGPAATHRLLPARGGAVPSAGLPWIDPATGLRLTRMTDLTDVSYYLSLNPGLPPRNQDKPVTLCDGQPGAGFSNGYSKYPLVNVTGEFMMAFRPDGLVAIYKFKPPTYYRTMAQSETNGLTEQNDPRWSRLPGEATILYYWLGDTLYKQDVTVGLASAQVVLRAECQGEGRIYSGGENDFDWSGRYWAAKFGHYDQAAGRFVNVRCGVVDLVGRRVLPGAVAQDPNAIDMSPSGEWLAILPHSSGTDLAAGNRFYRRTDLEAGDTSRPVLVDSAVVGGVRSIGHNGWGYNQQGEEVLVYQDDRDDGFKYFNPKTGASTQIFTMGLWGYSWGQHIASQKNPALPGWTLMSITGKSGGGDEASFQVNQLVMLELKPWSEGPRLWRLGNTNNRYQNYWSEAFASLDTRGRAVYWAGNWRGTDNLEIYQLELPANWCDALRTGAALLPYPITSASALWSKYD